MPESYDMPQTDSPIRQREQQFRKAEAEKAARADPYPSAHLGKAVPGEWAGQNAMTPTNSAPAADINLHNIDDLMHYQPWNQWQSESGDQVREALTLAAKAILRNCPNGRFRSVALRQIIDARMNANAAISFGGRF